MAVLWVGDQFTLVDWVRIDAIRLRYLAQMSHNHTYMVMVIALCEHWHSEMASFHLLMGEMIITLEDVY